ncbi:PAS [Nesidiocoris tenuis]|uniref:PAS n=1 Tax=Nesidiocoris tenuis TaxID=355587 RepID=A0ABN7AQE9_9HEMI|nr:PAS [Nesidiocoris tenuis]
MGGTSKNQGLAQHIFHCFSLGNIQGGFFPRLFSSARNLQFLRNTSLLLASIATSCLVLSLYLLYRSFVVANAQQNSCHIIYCSDGFCRLTGYSRAEVMQRPAVCDFLHGPLTSQQAVAVVKEALAAGTEKHFEILYYKKDGTKFLCSEVIAPVKSEVDDICLYIINFEDLTSPQSPVDDTSSNHRLIDRARQSFRQSLRMGPLRRRPGTSGYLSPPPPTTEESDSALTPSPSQQGRLSTEQTTTIETDRLSQGGNRISASSPTAPIASPEQEEQALHKQYSSLDKLWDTTEIVPHASSLDGISTARRKVSRSPETPKMPARSATCSVPTRNHVAKCFPITSSESDLQKYRMSALWDPTASISNIHAESLRHKEKRKDCEKTSYSIQDNGSAKFFQGALHTPNMGERVAQIEHLKCTRDFTRVSKKAPLQQLHLLCSVISSLKFG